MKTILNFLLCCMLCHFSAWGQCVNGTNTNPDPLYVSPSAAGPRTNTFDWRQRPMPVHKPGYEQFLPTGTYEFTSPFYSTSEHLEGIAAGANSDFSPLDGWELVKQDFGYLYKATNNSNPDVGTWNGQENDGSNFAAKPLAYFMLYNKYSTTLRILASTPIQGQISEDRIRVSLNLVAKDAFPLKYNNKPNIADLRTNGIFANATPVSSPLDQKTSNLELSAFAVFPSTKSEFFYADFLLGYDPCICFFKSALNVSFWTELTAQINLSGQLVGINRNIADVDAGIEGNDLNNFKSSFFFENNGTPKGIRQTYESIQDLKAEFNTNPVAAQAAEIIDLFLKGAVVGGGLNILPEGMKEFKEKGLEKISPYLDFFSALAKEGETGPTVLTANMEISGTLSSKTERAGYDFRFAIPGSLGAATCDEYNKENNALGTKPYAPLYNEVPGLFALLKTPTLKVKQKGPTGGVQRYACGSGGSNFCSHIFGNTSLYKLADEDILYAFNPIVDLTKTRIEAAIEVIDVPNEIGYSDYSVSTNIQHVTNTELINFILDNGNSAPAVEKGTYRKIRTEFYPIECLRNLVAKTTYDFQGLEADWEHKHPAFKAFIILNIYFVFNKDVYGKDHFTVQSIKYPLNFERTTDDLEVLPGLGGFNLPDYVNINNFQLPHDLGPRVSNIRTTLINGFMMDVLYGISLPGGPANPFAENTNVQSAGEVIVEPGYEIFPGFTLAVVNKDERICGNLVNMNPFLDNSIQSHCNSSLYQANTAFTRFSVSSDPQIIPPISSTSSLGYPIPNPTRGECSLSFNLAEEGGYAIQLSNILGETVRVLAKSEFAKTGPQSITFDTGELESGVYFITFTSNGFRQARKLVVVK